jgi:hypothetical protein
MFQGNLLHSSSGYKRSNLKIVASDFSNASVHMCKTIRRHISGASNLRADSYLTIMLDIEYCLRYKNIYDVSAVDSITVIWLMEVIMPTDFFLSF